MSRRTLPGALLVLLAAAGIIGGGVLIEHGDLELPGGSDPAPSTQQRQDAGALGEASPTQVAAAQQDLAQLSVAPLATLDGYERDAFGQRWKDVDHNGCDQRNDALRAAAVATSLETKPGTHECVVTRAQIQDVYTGTRIQFVKGEQSVDIDHVVPLARAWRQGAAGWSAEQREQFANASEELVAVDASANRSKGDDGPEEWMPPAGGCVYAVRWVEVKESFALSVTEQEKSSLERVLEQCEGSAG